MNVRGARRCWFSAVLLAIVASAQFVTVSRVSAHDFIAPRSTTPVMAMSVAYDPARNLVYAAVRPPVGDPNNLVAVDPATHQIVDRFAVGQAADFLELSDDGSALYFFDPGRNQVTKLTVPSMQVEWSVPTLGGIYDLEVAPGRPDTVAIVAGGLTIVDAGTARPVSVTAFQMPSGIAFGADASTLYGIRSDGHLHRFDVASDGVRYGGLVATDVAAPLLRHGSTIYSANGKAIDVGATTPTVRIMYPLTNNGLGPAVDVASNTVLFPYREPLSAKPIIAEVDLDTAATLHRALSDDVNDVLMKDLTVLPQRQVVYAGVRPDGLVFADLTAPPDLRSAGEFTALTPDRLLDTRTGLGIDGGPRRVTAGSSIDVQVTGRSGIPASGVAAVVMNVTAVRPTSVGYLTIYPSDIARPEISSLNLSPGRTVANLVTVPVSSDGRVTIFNPFGDVDVIADVAGFVATADGPDGTRFTSIRPARQVDTRNGPDPLRPGAPLGAGGTLTHRIVSAPFRVQHPTAAVLNITVTGATAPSYVSVFPADVERPLASNLNFGSGDTVANQVIVRVPPSGDITVYNEAGLAHVIIDVVGFFDDTERFDEGRFVAFDPFRAVDTRVDSPFEPPGDLWSGDILYIGDPDTEAQAFVLNVTVTGTVGSGYVVAYPFSVASPNPPVASTVNYTGSVTVPNHAITSTGPYVGFYNFGGRTHLVVDVFGAFI